MSEKSKENSAVVKIDTVLMGKIEEFIKKAENRFKFNNKKQFVDIAVYEFLRKNEKEDLKKK